MNILKSFSELRDVEAYEIEKAKNEFDSHKNEIRREAFVESKNELKGNFFSSLAAKVNLDKGDAILIEVRYSASDLMESSSASYHKIYLVHKEGINTVLSTDESFRAENGDGCGHKGSHKKLLNLRKLHKALHLKKVYRVGYYVTHNWPSSDGDGQGFTNGERYWTSDIKKHVKSFPLIGDLWLLDYTL